MASSEDRATLGVDIGSSRTKAVAYDSAGAPLAAAVVERPYQVGPGNRVEQDPERVLAGVVEVVREVSSQVEGTGTSVACLGFTSAMHSILALDRSALPLTPAATWADNRAVDVVQDAREMGEPLYERTGVPFHAMSPLAKLLWFRLHEPDVFAAAAKWVSLKEYVLLRFTGVLAADRSSAAATGMLDVGGDAWCDAALDLAGIESDELPDVVSPLTEVGPVLPDVARAAGLRPGTSVVAGATDGVAVSLGLGAARDVWSCSIGTSAALRWLASTPRLDLERRTFCYAVDEGLWLVGAATNNAGNVVDWAFTHLFPDLGEAARTAGRTRLDVADDLAREAPPGSGGLVFLPYLSGERSPAWDPALSGGLIGLTRRHRRNHVARSLLEGVALALRSVYGVLSTLEGPPRAVRATGGGVTGSALWPRILADALGRSVAVADDPEMGARGAALTARAAARGEGLVDVMASWGPGRARDVEPDPAGSDALAATGEVYEALAGAIDFDALARLRSGMTLD